ncbi:hypothetical protein EU527_10055 [Candidatus Thorarchaeota archaeon]|nr:MAG: hypothetical protein EU527_10055 [Candidatus Thorarchaeota archaeon]
MFSSNRSRFLIALLLTWFVLSPYVTTVSNFEFSVTPTNTMEIAAPTISGPAFYEFENGSRGDTLEYDAYDPNPKNYSVIVDGGNYLSGVWDGNAITVLLVYLYTLDMIDTLPQEFAFVVTVFNQAGESAIAATTVRVIQDETAPIIQQPANITYEYGSFGHEIQWNITESNPEFYNITRLSNETGTNFTIIESGDWDGDDIIINIDGLNESRWYIYTLFVRDIFGLNVSSAVNVTVYPDLSSPELSSPDDISFEFGALGNKVTWHVYDSNPKNYTITGIVHYNDTLYGNYTAFNSFANVTMTNWTLTNPDGDDVSIILDWFFLGNYTFIIQAFDIYGRNSTDSVFVYIYPDVRAPIIDPDEDLLYEEGYTGYSITWGVEENNPLWYNLTVNGDSMLDGIWRGENITIDVDNLDVGSYEYNMTFSDFFGSASYAIITVTVTPDAHLPIITTINVFQTYSTPTKNNLSVQAYAWDLNNLKSIEVEWGVGSPTAPDFNPASKIMERAILEDFYEALIGEYSHGVVVWFRIIAIDNSSVQNEEVTEWMSITITDMSYTGVPAPLYAIIALLGGLSLLVFIVIYFRTKVK